IFQKGKSYYFFPVILTVLPFGGLFLSQFLAQKANWMYYPVIFLYLLGMALIPFGMPVYTFQHYLNSIYKYENKTLAGATSPVKYEEYYATEKWTETMKSLSKIHERLSTEEKKNCVIWGKHYGQAGAINMYRNDYNLPKAFSCHGSYYNWMPKGKIPDTIIALSYQVGDFFNPYFEEVNIVDSIYNPYADNEEELYQIIYVCKKPKQSFDNLKELFRERIFE
ncbi:MAG: hypothetical protein IT269_00160, partial [Saprospiraceae bacterium]|nr:hypothetical protein [Saprospiraceae bacterium]